MSRNRIIYQNEALYAGPSLKTGIATGVVPGHYILKNIENVTSISYGINTTRQDLVQLGSQGIVARPIFESPILDLSFSYNFNGFGNETKLGFNTNFSTGQNIPKYANNFSVALMSGFINPNRERDKRDFYIALADEGEDVFQENSNLLKSSDLTTLTGIIESKSPTFDILNLQECYLTKYSFSARVNELVKCSLGYLVSNIMVFSSGSGVNVYTLDKVSGVAVKTGINIVIPKFSRSPEDVVLSNLCVLDIKSSDESSLSENLSFSIADAKFRSFTFDLNLSRDSLKSVSHKMPLDNPIKFPIIANFNLEGINGDVSSGDFLSFFRKDNKIDLTISMNRFKPDNPIGQLNSKIFIKKAQINSVFSSSEIGNNKSFSIAGQVDLDSLDLSKGMFFSGVLPSGVLDLFLLKSGVLDI